ncbi:MAG TPA: DUF6252 family protein [Bacteroidales bacterium]|nr:DUF6252 family protein [Bacteroidales bacterium]HPS74657.1 DUF6252 family protein [Bacteroidales bacterium]
MKKTLLIALVAALIMPLVSCNKDDNNDLSIGFSADINGTHWNGDIVAAIHSTDVNMTTITATSGLGSDKVILMFKGSGKGTYSFVDNYNTGSVFLSNSTYSSEFLETPVGEIVITKYDEANNKISGTFSFSAQDYEGNSCLVSSGEFENVLLTTF